MLSHWFDLENFTEQRILFQAFISIKNSFCKTTLLPYYAHNDEFNYLTLTSQGVAARACELKNGQWVVHNSRDLHGGETYNEAVKLVTMRDWLGYVYLGKISTAIGGISAGLDESDDENCLPTPTIDLVRKWRKTLPDVQVDFDKNGFQPDEDIGVKTKGSGKTSSDEEDGE